MSRKSNSWFGLAVAVTLVTFIIYVIVWRQLDIVVFSQSGTNSLAVVDAHLQYLDYFSWYKNVFSGNDSLIYSFNSALGQRMIGIFAYYLASPFNLLLLLFPKTHLEHAFNLIVTLKLALSAGTMVFYLRHRFPKLKTVFVSLLALGYGMMQYNIAQAQNVMWLDGVYMLPIILLGVYYLVRYQKSLLYIISLALTVLFNWYTGGINCLAVAIWFFVELLLSDIQGLQNYLKKFAYMIAASLAGLLLSMMLFLPAILALRMGRGASFDWSSLRLDFTGNILSSLHAYLPGTVSTPGYPALFCGSLSVVAIGEMFISGRAEKKKKVVLACLLAVLIFIFYFQPFILTFSLFKQANSYCFRYSYVASFGLLYIGAFALGIDHEEKYDRAAWILIFFALILDYVSPHTSRLLLYGWLVALLMTALLLNGLKKANLGNHKSRVLAICLLMVGICEMAVNGYKLGKTYSTNTVENFMTYQEEEIELINDLREYDTDLYRITQTMDRNMSFEAITANLNENMAYGYMALESYTSSPQNTQLNLAEKLGYPIYGDCVIEKKALLLPADSLLGVKYVLSPQWMKGLKEQTVASAEALNGKYIYENPYTLPIAFRFSELQNTQSAEELEAGNPFIFWNKLYRELSGIEEDIMVPLTYEETVLDGEIQYTVDLPKWEHILYGNIPPTSERSSGAKLNINNWITVSYSSWLAIGTFYCPTEDGDETASIIYRADNSLLDKVETPQFYALDLEKFEAAVNSIQNKAANVTEMSKGKMTVTTSANAGEHLFISVPYDEGWTITNNGAEAEVKIFEDCLLDITLTEGENTIVMKYTLPGQRAGIILSLAGLCLIICIQIFTKKEEK